MYAHRTAVLLALVTVVVAGAGGAAAMGAPPAVQAENTTVDHSGEAVTLVTGPNATVTGETSLDAGTNLTIRMRSSGESPFLFSNGTSVRDDGRFVATFDLSEVPDGTNATLSVRSGGEELAEVPVRLVAERTPTATASPTPNGTTAGDGPGFGGSTVLVAVLGGALVLTRRT